MERTIAKVEDFIIEQLKSTFGSSVKTIATIPSSMTEDLVTRLVSHAPGLFVALGKGEGLKGSGNPKSDLRFEVLVVVKNQGAETQARRGDSKAIGAYDMLEIAIPALHDETLTDVGTLKHLGFEPVMGDAVLQLGATIFVISFSFSTSFTKATPADLDNFTTFDIKYDLKPEAVGEPVANDTITLPTE